MDAETEEPMFFHVQYWFLTANEAEKTPSHAPRIEADGVISLPSSYCYTGSNGGGSTRRQNAPAALFLQYTVGDEDYTCVVRPEGEIG